jgi:hypothetical protein
MPQKKFSPFTRPKFTREQVLEVFGPGKGTGAVANRLFKENPALYQEIKQSAITEHGLLAPPRANPWWGKNGEPKQRVYSDEEIAARAQFTEAECREMYGRSGSDGNKNNVSALAKDNPARLAILRAAAVSYGILPETPNTVVRPVPKPAQHEPEDDGLVAIGEDLARRGNLPAGLRVNQDKLNTIVKAVADVEIARREAEKGNTQEKK